MKSRAWLKSVKWVALLPVGILLILLARRLYQHPYDDSGFGAFHGYASGDFFATDNGNMYIRFKGLTEPEWRFASPTNYRYVDIDFEWDIESARGAGRLHLPTMTLLHSGEVTKIDQDWFYRLSGHEASSKAFLDLLIAARDGTLPRPRHHSHNLEGNIEGRLVHFSLGSRYPYPVLVYGFIWIIATIFVLMRRKRPTQVEEVKYRNPRAAF